MVISYQTSATPLPGRRQRRSAEIRERLFRSALRLFAQKGFAATTVEDITYAADVGKGTFFNYFPSKDHILLAFGEMQLAKLEVSIESTELGRVPLPEFLLQLAMRLSEEPGRNPGILPVILQINLSSSPVRKTMGEIHARAHALLARMIEFGQGRGEIRVDATAAELAHVFRQTMMGTLLVWSLYGDDTLLQRIESAFRILWSGLAPHGRNAPPLTESVWQ